MPVKKKSSNKIKKSVSKSNKIKKSVSKSNKIKKSVKPSLYLKKEKFSSWKKCFATGLLSGLLLMILNYVFSLVSFSQVWYTQNFPGLMMMLSSSNVVISSFITGLFFGIVYGIVHGSFKGDIIHKGFKFGFVIWLIVGVTWLVLTMGFSPVMIWAFDLVQGLLTYTLLGVITALVYGRI